MAVAERIIPRSVERVFRRSAINKTTNQRGVA